MALSFVALIVSYQLVDCHIPNPLALIHVYDTSWNRSIGCCCHGFILINHFKRTTQIPWNILRNIVINEIEASMIAELYRSSLINDIQDHHQTCIKTMMFCAFLVITHRHVIGSGGPVIIFQRGTQSTLAAKGTYSSKLKWLSKIEILIVIGRITYLFSKYTVYFIEIYIYFIEIYIYFYFDVISFVGSGESSPLRK